MFNCQQRTSRRMKVKLLLLYYAHCEKGHSRNDDELSPLLKFGQRDFCGGTQNLFCKIKEKYFHFTCAPEFKANTKIAARLTAPGNISREGMSTIRVQQQFTCGRQNETKSAQISLKLSLILIRCARVLCYCWQE